MEASNVVGQTIETIMNELENYSPVNQRKILVEVSARIESNLDEKIAVAEANLKEARERKGLFLHGAPELANCAE